MFSLKNIVRFLFGLLILLTAGNFSVLLLEDNNTSKRLNKIMHTYKVIEQSELMLSHMLNAETGQRGFLLTGQKKYLEPYHTGISSAHSSFDKLRKLTMDNPVQQKHLDAIERLMSNKFDELEKTIRLTKNNAIAEALSIVKENHGKDQMDNIRNIIETFNQEEQRLLLIRDAQYKENKTFLISIYVLEAMLLIGVILIIAFVFRRRMVSPILELTS